MDQEFDIRLVEEEEKSGWTILSTVCDDKLDETEEQGTDSDPVKDSVEPIRDVDSCTLNSVEKSHEEDALSDDAEEVIFSEGDDDADDELTDCGLDEAREEEGSPFSDSDARAYVWDMNPIGEDLGKQIIVQQQPVQKQGIIWRVSLVATLGLFGWAVLSGLGSGGKNVRCLKMQPCSLKEGEPVLSTM